MSEISDFSPEGLLRSAMNLQARGEFFSAGKIYEMLLKHDINNVDVLHLFGLLKAEKGEVKEGLTYIDKAIALKPEEPLFYGNRGNILRKLDRLLDAKRAYEHSLKLDPNQVGVLNNLATLLQSQSANISALELLMRSWSLQPGHPATGNNLALVLQDLGRYDEAEGYFLKVLKVMPLDVEVLNNLGALYREVGAFSKARRYLLKAMKADPSVAEPHVNMGHILREQGKWEKAGYAYEEALRLDPYNCLAFIGLGLLYQAQDQRRKAEYNFRQAIHNDPAHLDAYMALADMCYEYQRLDEAIDVLDQILAQDANHVEALALKGLILISEMEIVTAEEVLTKALQAKPFHAQALFHRSSLWLAAEHVAPIVTAYKLAFEKTSKYTELFDGFAHFANQSSFWSDELFTTYQEDVAGMLEMMLIHNYPKVNLLFPLMKRLLLRMFDERPHVYEPLFLLYLRKVTNRDPELEAAFLEIRDLVCARLLAGEKVEEAAGSLVCQCVRNGYVWPGHEGEPLDGLAGLMYEPQAEMPDNLPESLDLFFAAAKGYDEPSVKIPSLGIDEHLEQLQRRELFLPFCLEQEMVLELHGPKSKILYLGCGFDSKVFGVARAYPFAEIVCIDPSMKLLVRAKNWADILGLRHIHFLHGDPFRLNQLEGKFDHIEASTFLDYWYDGESLLRVLGAKLKPEGTLCMDKYNCYGVEDLKEVQALGQVENLTQLRRLRESAKAKGLDLGDEFYDSCGFYHLASLDLEKAVNSYHMPDLAERLQFRFMFFEVKTPGGRAELVETLKKNTRRLMRFWFQRR